MQSELAWITTISFIFYCGLLSYLDWNYRDIRTHYIWLPLIAINIPVLIAGYVTGEYREILFLVSILGIIFWTVLLTIKKLNGADYIWLSLISLFMVLNPVTGEAFMQMFSFYLIGMTAATYWAIFINNLIGKHIISLKMERGIPYLIPISCALIMAVVMG